MLLYLFYIISGVILFRIFRCFSTPVLRKIGFYRYYSPLFCTMPFFNNTLDIHLGTSWDFFRIKNMNPRKIFAYLSSGLLELAKAVENGSVAGNKILRGNVYYLHNSTFEKYGFKSRKLNFVEFLLFLQNYPELCLLQSISMKKISLVSFKKLNILTCRASDLVKQIHELELITARLNKNKNTVFNLTKKKVKNEKYTEPVLIEQ